VFLLTTGLEFLLPGDDQHDEFTTQAQNLGWDGRLNPVHTISDSSDLVFFDIIPMFQLFVARRVFCSVI
jgi:hypothetical protein